MCVIVIDNVCAAVLPVGVLDGAVMHAVGSALNYSGVRAWHQLWLLCATQPALLHLKSRTLICVPRTIAVNVPANVTAQLDALASHELQCMEETRIRRTPARSAPTHSDG